MADPSPSATDGTTPEQQQAVREWIQRKWRAAPPAGAPSMPPLDPQRELVARVNEARTTGVLDAVRKARGPEWEKERQSLEALRPIMRAEHPYYHREVDEKLPSLPPGPLDEFDLTPPPEGEGSSGLRNSDEEAAHPILDTTPPPPKPPQPDDQDAWYGKVRTL